MTRADLARTVLTVLGTWFCVFNSTLTRGDHRTFELIPPANGKVGFTQLGPQESGIRFTNDLRGDAYLTNSVAHNGSGVAIGDVDADGRPDIYFCNLQGANELYRNAGNWRFEKMEIGAADCAVQSSTGAVLADLDGDEDLDLLVNGITAGTRLFLNNGKGVWAEARESGLSRANSPTSMALADIDGDGDLDIYCTHYIDVMHLADPTTRFAMGRRDGKWEVTRVNGESTRMPKWKDRFEALPNGGVRELPERDALYRNEGGGRFKAIQDETGVFLNEQGEPMTLPRDWGLAVMFRDINGDGAPDFYVCNDNASPDRLWMNTGKGTFRLAGSSVLRHTSRSSMGLDFADVDRDGRDDFIVVDMLARDHVKRMTQLSKDYPSRTSIDGAEEQPRFNRNMLFLGQSTGTFQEIGLMAGLAGTDWSWCPVFLDVDLDGYEDLLVSNGFSFDVMDQDSSDEIKKSKMSEAQRKRQRRFHPRWPTKMAAFRNVGDGIFQPKGEAWGFTHEGISYGMALGDLDIDGDLDLVVNKLNEPAGIYRNDIAQPRIAVRLRGLKPNTEGIGARIRVIGGKTTQEQEMISGGRYMSSDQAMRVFAAEAGKAMSIEVNWRNGRRTLVTNVQGNRIYEIQQSGGDANVVRDKGQEPYFKDASSLIGHRHEESPFDDWARQALLPWRISELGPGLSWFDVDGDGWEDLSIGTGRGGRTTILRNNEGLRFQRSSGPGAGSGDQNAIIGWTDGIGKRKLIVTESGFETGSTSEAGLIIVNLDGPGGENVRLTLGNVIPGPVCSADIDDDGDLDVFVGGQGIPGDYPEPSDSFLFLNTNGEPRYDEERSIQFRKLGIVRGATFADLDEDGDPDLALATEWGPIRIFRNSKGRFEDVSAELGLSETKGLWTGISAGDFDGDGKLDLAAGNWGRNSEYELGDPTAWRVYYGDWNGDGVVEVLEAWKKDERWYPVRNRDWLARGWPELQQRFPTHAAYARSNAEEILGDHAASAKFLEALQLESSVFLNRGARFERIALPQKAQVSPMLSVNVGDLDGDGFEDILGSQNFYGGAGELSRDDAGRGLWLQGNGDGTFRVVDAAECGINVPGEHRGAALADFNHDGRVDLAVAQNDGETKLYTNVRAKPGLRVQLKGLAANPNGVGATLRIRSGNGKSGPTRSVRAGSGYLSQDGATQVLGLIEGAEALLVRWPGGKEQNVRIDGKNEIEVQFQK